VADRPAGSDDDRARARRLTERAPALGLLALVAGAVSISLGVIVAKQAFADGASPHAVLFARMTLGALIVAPVLPFALRSGGRRVGWRPIALGAAAGAALGVAGRFELEGLSRLPAGTLAVLLATIPIWVTAVAWLGFGRVPTGLERLAIGSVVVGVAVMALPVGAAIDPLGAAFGILTTFCFTAFLMALERNRAVPAATGFLLGLAGSGLLLLLTTPGTVSELTGGDFRLPLVLAAGATTAVWALLVGTGLEATDSVTASIVIGVEPVVVAVLALVLLGEGLSARELVGGVVVLAGVVATTVQVASASQRPAAVGGGVPEAPGAVQGEADRAG
jgi:drug/metabolite transporter (DMT)-like permease